jgi:hypothetical protein
MRLAPRKYSNAGQVCKNCKLGVASFYFKMTNIGCLDDYDFSGLARIIPQSSKRAIQQVRFQHTLCIYLPASLFSNLQWNQVGIFLPVF